MPHVVILNGSPRKGITHTLLTEISEGLVQQRIRVTMISLADHEIGDCIGCEACIRKASRCWQNDDTQAILAQLVEADGVVVASPVYMMNATGKLKSLIDKTASWFLRPPMVGKPALLVATTAGAGLKETLRYLEQVVSQWGAHPTGRIGRSVMTQRPVDESEISDFLWHLRHERSEFRPSLNQLTLYQVQKVMALKTSTLDREFWSARGWDRQLYYYACRIGWLKRVFARAFYRMLYRRIKPVSPF